MQMKHMTIMVANLPGMNQIVRLHVLYSLQAIQKRETSIETGIDVVIATQRQIRGMVMEVGYRSPNPGTTQNIYT